MLARVALVRPDDSVLSAAELLQPPELRSLDAIHLATALMLGGDLEALVSYDRRLLRAAQLAGVATATPK